MNKLFIIIAALLLVVGCTPGDSFTTEGGDFTNIEVHGSDGATVPTNSPTTTTTMTGMEEEGEFVIEGEDGGTVVRADCSPGSQAAGDCRLP